MSNITDVYAVQICVSIMYDGNTASATEDGWKMLEEADLSDRLLFSGEDKFAYPFFHFFNQESKLPLHNQKVREKKLRVYPGWLVYPVCDKDFNESWKPQHDARAWCKAPKTGSHQVIVAFVLL